MTRWDETYNTVPLENNKTPPDGAPEGHFPSAVNDIQRQALAAIAELGESILGPDNNANPPPQSKANTLATQANGFSQLIYDLIYPVGKIVMWNSKHDGVSSAKEYPVPAGVVASWQRCDGTNNTPDTRQNIIAGADPAQGLLAGDVLGDADTGGAGAFELLTPVGLVKNHTLSISEMPNHDHNLNETAHKHTLNETAHKHTLNETAHKHTLNESDHNHPLTDPGHGHTNSTDADREGTGIWGPEGAGIAFQSATVDIDPNTTGITIAAVSTGITMDNESTGITMDNESTGITMDTESTGITMETRGGSTGHDHVLEMDDPSDIPNHEHTMDPTRTLVEYWQRLAT